MGSGLLQKPTLLSISPLTHNVVSLLPRNQVVVVMSQDVRDQSNFSLNQDFKQFLCLIQVPCPLVWGIILSWNSQCFLLKLFHFA